jgi:hypothetical protein
VRSLIIYSFLILIACSKKEKNSDFESQRPIGLVSGRLHEASGMAASITNPGYIWTHNDSGNSALIYLINDRAEIVMTCKLKNTVNRDWEDITIVPGPEENVNYLYIADIGDNEAVYSYKILYRIKEPTFLNDQIEIEKVDKFIFELPGGARDTEAIMVDPITNYFYVFSKREHSVRLYEIRFPFARDTLHVEEVGKLPFNNVVAANISSDGSEVLVKTYRDIYYWKREANEPIAMVLQREPIKLDYNPEPQGEAITWKLDGSGFYTLSESVGGKASSLFFYKRKQ